VAHGGGFAYAGGIALPSTVTMNNDGGWCGGLSYTTEGGHVFGVPMHLTKQPDHGEVSIRVETREQSSLIGQTQDLSALTASPC
jgi:hypothetical protein